MWSLQGAGRGYAALGGIEGSARGALAQIHVAGQALAQTDISSGHAAFSRAETLLGQARLQLETALSDTERVLKIIDVTGTVTSGEHLLVTGEKLSKAGQHVTSGLANIFGTSPLEHQLVQSIEEAIGEFREAATLLEEAQESLAKVESPLLPENIQQGVKELEVSLPALQKLLGKIIDQSDPLLTMLGNDRDRQYLLLFANNHELRPVGGFVGTTALVNVDRGRIENIDVKSVYDGDGQLKSFIAPPAPLLPIVGRWYLRDANWFVDFEHSARKIAGFFEKEGGPTVDGVILMTPEVTRRLLEIAGPIQVPGYDVEVTSENFFVVTQGEVTYAYDREKNQPKQFLADLTPLLFNKLFQSTGTKGELLLELADALDKRELLLFMRDSTTQEKIRTAGWAGSLPDDAQGFLYVNNANIGGHKSDQFIDQEIDYRSSIEENGDIEAMVTIRRTHNGPQEAIDYPYPAGDDPAYKDNIVYQRVFVPDGAQLLEAHGFTSVSDIPKAKIERYDTPLEGDSDVVAWQADQRTHTSGTTIGKESGYTYFANWVLAKPGDTAVGFYRYRIPRHAKPSNGFLSQTSSYTTFIKKQPGQIRSTVRASIRVPDGFTVVHTEPASGITLDESGEIVYRGKTEKDHIIGVVYDRI